MPKSRAMLIHYAVETCRFLPVLEQLSTLGEKEDISPHYIAGLETNFFDVHIVLACVHCHSPNYPLPSSDQAK